MKHMTFATLFVLISSTAALSQPASPQPVSVANWLAVQPVTGGELRDSREALLLLLLQTSGALPHGSVPLQFDECEISGVADFLEDEIVRVAPGKTGCDLETYARTCEVAARRHRNRCREICAEFRVTGDARSCRGNDHPTIEVFYPSKHCQLDPELGSTVTCAVTGWCNCDP